MINIHTDTDAYDHMSNVVYSKLQGSNAYKFQLVLFGRQEVASNLNIGDTAINSEPVVKLLGVSVDRTLAIGYIIIII